MSTRVGIDLTASRCALVAAATTNGTARVQSFRSIAFVESDRAELQAALKSAAGSGEFPGPAHAVLWGVRNLCVTLPVGDDSASVQDRAIEAAHALSPGFRAWADEAWVHLSITGDRAQGGREACFVAASGSDIRKRLRTIERAGFAVDGVSTPASALATLARLRRSGSPDAVTAYVALNRESGCIAIVKGSRLIAARDLAWTPGVDRAEVPRQLLERYVFVSRVAPELRHVFAMVRRLYGVEVTQIITCGDLSDLRSLTMPLIDELDIEVETLDSMEGIEVRALPEPRDQFREQIAGLRLALAVAAATPPIELAPMAHQPRRRTAGMPWIARGLSAAAALVMAFVFWPGAGQSQATAATDVQLGRAPASSAPEPAPLAAVASPPAASADTPPDSVTGSEPQPPADEAETDGGTRSAGSRVAPVEPSGGPDTERAPSDGATVAEVRDPVVTSILFAPDRRLAVVDGQIMGIGDALGGGVIMEITREAVVVRTPAGEQRHVLRGAPGSQ